MKRLRACALTGCCLFLLSACTVKLIYNQLDWLTPRYLDDFITLDEQQADLLDVRLAAQLRWHRTTQLPEYARWLRDLNRELDQGLERDRIAQRYQAVRGYWREIKERLAPDLARLLASTSDRQVASMLERMEERRETYRLEYVDLPKHKLLRERGERMEKALERWVGELTAEQERAVELWSRDLHPIGRDGLGYRLRWQAELKRILARRRDAAWFQQSLQELLRNPVRFAPPSYVQMFDQNVARSQHLIFTVYTLLTSDQRQHLRDRIESFARDFDELARS